MSDTFNKPVYKRILLKLSGEALAAGSDGILNFDFVNEVCATVKECVEAGTEVAIVVGAGNIWRGRQGGYMDRNRADHMGMLATTINSLALQDTLINLGVDARVLTAVEMKQFAEVYTNASARRHLAKGRVVIFGCGIGSPFFSTDTTAALRAAEIGADVILMAKNIDGVYTADPKVDPSAVRLDEITYSEILAKGLKVIDTTAASFCMENNIPLFVFGLDKAENIKRAVMGENIGTIVKAGK
ncbi:MAG: UMP kinase [Ruminococcaceae bacterium]|nr:UMP kinase [Oscillospiraceae bacterium]